MVFPVMAVLGGAAIAGSLLGASKAAKAAKNQAQLEYEAAEKDRALQERIYEQTRADNEPFRQVGLSASSALASGFGLSTPSMTGKTSGGYAGTSPVEPTPSMTRAPDYAAYGAENADVAAEWQRIQQTGNAGAFGNDPNAYYASHYQTHGQGEGRALPTTGGAEPAATLPAPQAPVDPNAPPAGYSDPTAQGGYSVGARPEPGEAPPTYSGSSLDVGLGAFRASPDYEFRKREQDKFLNNLMSARGGVFGGQRIKAGLERSGNLADGEYTDWRDYTTGQYNQDRNFGYGMSRDARGDFEYDTARSDGLYADDRSRLDNRYDTRNSQLMSLAGFGTGANTANQNAAQTFAQGSSAATMTGARARGGAAINSANAWNGAINNVMTTGAYLYANR